MSALNVNTMRAIFLQHAGLHRVLWGSIWSLIQRSWHVSDTVWCTTTRPARWIAVTLMKEEEAVFLTQVPRLHRGGYKKFSACYHFLRTQRILWMPRELASLQTYPVEILPAKLYMGNFKQACDQQIQKDLKIKAQVNISEQHAALFADSDRYLHVSVPDTLEADLFSSFPTICHFIDAQLDHGAVLVFSSLGISRSSTGIMAYLIHSCVFSLKRAWSYVLKCKTNMRPHQGFVKQLLDWETKIYRTPVTDISELDY
ncbi:serine/threonine/tyrosine-interacting-like protein 1 isoform 3-T3 [Guaruba guarouba]